MSPGDVTRYLIGSVSLTAARAGAKTQDHYPRLVHNRSQSWRQGVVAVCYSARVLQTYQQYVRRFGARIGLREFAALYGRCGRGEKIKTAKALDDAFLHADAAATPVIAEIAGHIRSWNAVQAAELKQLLFRQRKRLAGAERTLRGRPTRKATDDQRVATARIDWAKDKLAGLRRSVPEDRDRCIRPNASGGGVAFDFESGLIEWRGVHVRRRALYREQSARADIRVKILSSQRATEG